MYPVKSIVYKINDRHTNCYVYQSTRSIEYPAFIKKNYACTIREEKQVINRIANLVNQFLAVKVTFL